MCFHVFWKSSLFKGAWKSVFVANLWLISLEVLVSPEGNDPDRHELLLNLINWLNASEQTPSHVFQLFLENPIFE